MGRPAPGVLLPPDRGVRFILTAPPVTVWTLIVDSAGRPGRDNMRLDAALLRTAREGAAFLRLYRWSPPCLSFGRHEPATRRYDRARIESLGLDTVRRPTGGRAVWHDDEVTYAVAGPVAMFGTLAETYRRVHEMLAAGLRTLGVRAELAGDRGTVEIGGGACFAAPAGGEVLVHGRKLVGSAQVREGAAFLQHGSILLENRQQVVAEVTRGAPPPEGGIGLREVLARHVAFDEVSRAIIAAAQHAWPGPWRDGPAPTIDDHRFADPAWTWKR